MGTMREGYNLFTKVGWYHLKKNWRYNKLQYVYEDTFGGYICKVVGHTKKTFQTNDIPPEKICYRCYKVVR